MSSFFVRPLSQVTSGPDAGQVKRERVAVIMAGGQGTRFWPLSTVDSPKQYLPQPLGSESLIQATAGRLGALGGVTEVIVVTAPAQVKLADAHLPLASIIAEPVPRNTAPCLAWAAQSLLRWVGDVPMLVVPADHMIADVGLLHRALLLASEAAQSSDTLVTIGISPTRPETGYGYIKAGRVLQNPLGEGDAGECSLCEVEKFVEKPSLDTARDYLIDGRYYWNSGMFAWRPSVFLEAVRKYLPDLHDVIVRADVLLGDWKNSSPEDEQKCKQMFERLEKISVDVGILERANNVCMVQSPYFGWSDVGSWSSWAECASVAGEDANVIRADATMIGSSGCVVLGRDRFVACVGLKDIVVVDSGDALLVCHKDAAQDVKKVVEHLQENNRHNLL